MKKNFIICLVLSLYTNLITAQAYDGVHEGKFYLGYMSSQGLSGIDFQIDKGISDYFSSGFRFNYIFNYEFEKPQQIPGLNFEIENTKDSFINKANLGFFLRFHFMEVFKLEDNIDPYVSVEATFKSLGANIGCKYNFTDSFGVYAQFGKGFSNSLASFANDESDFINIYGKNSYFVIGLTFF
jgi:outer membrane protein G